MFFLFADLNLWTEIQRNEFKQIKEGFVKKLIDSELLLSAKIHAVSENNFSGI